MKSSFLVITTPNTHYFPFMNSPIKIKFKKIQEGAGMREQENNQED